MRPLTRYAAVHAVPLRTDTPPERCGCTGHVAEGTPLSNPNCLHVYLHAISFARERGERHVSPTRASEQAAAGGSRTTVERFAQLDARLTDTPRERAALRAQPMAMNLLSLAGAWGVRLLDIFAPSTCAACAGPRAGAAPFCETCGSPAPVMPWGFDGVPLVVAGAYQAPLAPAIRRFKFEGHSELARELAGLLYPRLGLLDVRAAGFVPVPLHRSRLVERGYNQSALVARCLARHFAGRAVPRGLERLRATEQQARLGRAARSENVRDAFRARPGAVPPRSVLVDDVVTTGATVRACLKALREAGSEVLAVVALARADGAG